MTRTYTNLVLDAVAEGIINKDALIQILLMWMSEHDVMNMVLANDLKDAIFPEDEGEED